MKHLFVKKGFVQEFIDRDARRLPEKSGFYDLQKWIKRVFNWLNIPYHDPCCDAERTTTPVRYNTETSTLEFYNGTTKEWEEVSSGV